jgi:hypothetical protein
VIPGGCRQVHRCKALADPLGAQMGRDRMIETTANGLLSAFRDQKGCRDGAEGEESHHCVRGV